MSVINSLVRRFLNRLSSRKHTKCNIYTDSSVTVTGNVNWTHVIFSVLIFITEVLYSEIEDWSIFVPHENTKG